MQRRNKHTLVSLLLSHIIHQMRHYMLYKGHQFWPRSQRMQLSVHCSSSLSSRIWCAAIDSRLRATDCTVEKAGKSVNYYRRTGQKNTGWMPRGREGGRGVGVDEIITNGLMIPRLGAANLQLLWPFCSLYFWGGEKRIYLHAQQGFFSVHLSGPSLCRGIPETIMTAITLMRDERVCAVCVCVCVAAGLPGCLLPTGQEAC